MCARLMAADEVLVTDWLLSLRRVTIHIGFGKFTAFVLLEIAIEIGSKTRFR